MATATWSDHYKILGVAPDADAGAIKTAYRKLVLKCHPDKVSDPALKEQKQDEFQKVQQSYETLSDPDKRQRYDLELRARELREERDRTRPRTTPVTTRTANVRVSTHPDYRSPQASPPKTSSYKSYSGAAEYKTRDPIFATYRSKHSYEPEMRSGRSASDEKLRRDDYRDSRESRRREEERESERRAKEKKEREKEEYERRKYERLQRELRDREEREYREAQAAKAKAEKKAKEREKERRKQAEDGEKVRAKPRSPYVEPYYTEDVDDRKSRKTKSPKKESSSARDKSSSKHRDRSSAREEVPPPSPPPELPVHSDAMKSKLDYAANYISSKSRPLPKHAPEAPVYSEPYPDPNIKWAVPQQRRSSGEARHAQADPIEIIDGGSPSHPGFDTSSAQAAPPRLQKMHTTPPGQMYTSTDIPYVPKRATLNRAQTMEPEYLVRHNRYKPSRGGRPSLEEIRDDYYLDKAYTSKTYAIKRGGDGHVPRVSESYYGEHTPSPSSGPFGKFKTAQYRPENVERTRSYGMKDAVTMDYQPTFSATASASAAVYSEA